MDAHRWYMEKKKKEKDRRDKGDTARINRVMNREIVSYYFQLTEEERANLSPVIRRIDRELVSSTILRLSYADNFESINVAVWQIAFLKLIKNRNALRFITQINSIDYGSSQKIEQAFRELKSLIKEDV